MGHQTDDPYHKTGIVEKRGNGYVVVIDRASYYPYYTGNRRNAFEINSQNDLDRLEVEITE
jgi:hypothetical protein